MLKPSPTTSSLPTGSPSETFLDAAGRATFDQYQAFINRYGVERSIPEMNRLRLRHLSQRLLPVEIKLRSSIRDELISIDWCDLPTAPKFRPDTIVYAIIRNAKR